MQQLKLHQRGGMPLPAIFVFLLTALLLTTPGQSAAGLLPGDTAAPPELANIIAAAPRAEDYPNAAKATLRDLADITLRPDGSSRTVTRQVIKIFNERARDEAQVRIPYHGQDEIVTVTHARTIRPDGSVMNLAPADVIDQAAESGAGMYTDARVKAFVLPAVDSGCVIDYEYVTEQKQSPLPGHFWTGWYFQGGVNPVQLSRLRVTAPKSVVLREKQISSTIAPQVTTNNDGSVTSVWEARDVAPLQPEPMMPDPRTLLPTLHLTTVPSWQTVARWYWNLAEARMQPDDTIRTRVAEVTAGKNTPEEKAKAIFYYVQDKTSYVAMELGTGAFQPRPAGDVLAKSYGDCKDMTTLLVAMLRAANITAHPVLLGVGKPGDISGQLPTPEAFNHAICLAEIGGQKYWLDATAAVCAWGQVPAADQGVETLVIREGKGEFERIPEAKPNQNRVEQHATLTLTSDGTAKGTVAITGTGDNDMALRAGLLSLPPDRLGGFAENLAQRLGPNAQVSNVRVTDLRDKDQPVRVTYDVTIPDWAQSSGDDLLFFKARPEQTLETSASPFRSQNRNFSVAQSEASQALYQLDLTLPAGYAVLSAPKAVTIKGELGQFRRTVQQEKNRLSVTVIGENYVAQVPPARYSAVQNYYRDYLKAADERVVLQRK